MTPKSDVSKVFRNAVLSLANDHAFARPFVNSGRLSVPCIYDGFAGFGPDALDGPEVTRPGAACPDGPVQDGFLLDHLGGDFALLSLGTETKSHLRTINVPTPGEALRDRYLGAASQAVYLIRPDQHVVARWPDYNPDVVDRAIACAVGKEE